MRKLSLLFAGGVLLANAGAVRAQVTLIDTIGTGAGYNVNTANAVGDFIGDDPGSNNPVPTSASQAGYAAAPITFNQGVSLSTVDVIINVSAPTGTATVSNNLYGAIYTQGKDSNGVFSLSASTQVSSYFQFDLSSINAPAANPAESDGVGNTLSAVGSASFASGLALNGGSYFLVIAPKAGLNAQDSDPLLHLGYLLRRQAATVTSSSNQGSLSTAFASIGQGQFEQNGAQPGDTLSPSLLGTNGGKPAYYGVRVRGSVVPGPSSLLTLLAGGAPLGLSLLRRRRNR